MIVWFLFQTFVDSKGYMVTEMVMEEVTDDEPSPKKAAPPVAKQQQTLKLGGSDKPAAKPASKKAQVNAPQQKGISSFFSKKS